MKDSTSAKATTRYLIQPLPLWMSYRTLAENLGERQLSGFLRGMTT